MRSAKFEYFSMHIPNQTVKTRRPIMLDIKTSDPYDLKPVELTPAELDSVAGGNPALLAALAAAAAAIEISQRLARANDALAQQNQINKARKAASEGLKSAI
jgi:hypothetical protein